jgi:hypothetical protein
MRNNVVPRAEKNASTSFLDLAYSEPKKGAPVLMAFIEYTMR